MEASGTYGMKASGNFVTNFSILDGWWAEGYNGMNGWPINKDSVVAEDQDTFDANSLYDMLEKEIIPTYYNEDNFGIPNNYVDIMREAFISVLPKFSARRMLKDYCSKLYIKTLP